MLKRELIAREYEFVDRTLGELLAAAGPDTNVVMMSDHGFHAMDEEETKILINFDLVLERLGFLKMTEDGVDLERTQLYSYASPNRSLTKHVRFALAGRDPGGQVPADERSKIRRKLTRKLARVTYADQGTAFSVRDASPDELDQGADFVVEVLTEGVQKPLRYSGKNIRGAIRSLTRLSGTHGRKTPGIFIAAGPDLQTKLHAHRSPGRRHDPDDPLRPRPTGGGELRRPWTNRTLHRGIPRQPCAADHSDLGRTHRRRESGLRGR